MKAWQLLGMFVNDALVENKKLLKDSTRSSDYCKLLINKISTIILETFVDWVGEENHIINVTFRRSNINKVVFLVEVFHSDRQTKHSVTLSPTFYGTCTILVSKCLINSYMGNQNKIKQRIEHFFIKSLNREIEGDELVSYFMGLEKP